MATQINYIELKAKNIEETKRFYGKHFGWTFIDYGPDYVSFNEAGIDGGFVKTDGEITNGVLVVLYHDDLETIHDQLAKAGTTITIDIFSFPGGRRFHFLDPSGNELAIWSE